MSKFNLYAYNVLKSSRINLTSEYSFIISNLINLEHLIDMGQLDFKDFAQKLYELFKIGNYGLDIDRICVVYAEPLSSKLTTLTSFCSENIKNNTMNTGYSCYVSPNSTLFNIQKTDIRTYSDIQTIIQSYSDNTPQRSIKKLADMGIQSGLTVPLGTFGFFSGYLFINSVKKSSYDRFSDEDYYVLSLLKLITSNFLYRYLQKVVAADNYTLKTIESFKFGNKLDPEKFEQSLSTLLKSHFPARNISISMDKIKKTNILFNPSSLTYLLTKVLEIYDVDSKISRIEFSIDENEDLMCVKICDLKIPYERLAYLNELGTFIAKQIKVQNGNTEISMAIEKCHKSKEYSIEE